MDQALREQLDRIERKLDGLIAALAEEDEPVLVRDLDGGEPTRERDSGESLG
jgi:hypothetical protein